MIGRTPPRAILVEGAECSGKSTLIQALRDRPDPWDYTALSHRSGHQFDRYMREYVLARSLIFNRGHFSELVYSKLWGRESPFSAAEERVLGEYVGRYFLVVLCTADVAHLEARYARRDYSQRARCAELARIADLFEQQFHQVPHLRYVSTSGESLAQAVNTIWTSFNENPRAEGASR